MNNMSDDDRKEKPSIKIELIAALLLIPLVVVLGLALKRFPIFSPPAGSSPTPIVAGSATLIPTQAPQQVAVSTPQVQRSEKKAAQTVAIVIHAPKNAVTYTVEMKPGSLVADLMHQAESKGLQLVTKDFGGSLGLFIESINGVKNNATPNYYWQFYINGQRSSVGISSRRISPGDTVEWKYENEN